jgi:hypothetical protein
LTSTVLENVLESNRSCQVVTITAELSILVALGLNVGLEVRSANGAGLAQIMGQVQASGRDA